MKKIMWPIVVLSLMLASFYVAKYFGFGQARLFRPQAVLDQTVPPQSVSIALTPGYTGEWLEFDTPVNFTPTFYPAPKNQQQLANLAAYWFKSCDSSTPEIYEGVRADDPQFLEWANCDGSPDSPLAPCVHAVHLEIRNKNTNQLYASSNTINIGIWRRPYEVSCP